jgi:iron complex outermembrane receptor protein
VVSLAGIGLDSRVSSAQPASNDAPADPAAAPAAPATTPENSVSDTRTTGDSGTISGTIRSIDLEAPLSGATVSIEGTNVSTTTDEAGHFQLSAPAGRAVLRADFSGFRSVEKTVTVSAGRVSDVDLPMTLDQLLTEVVVVVGSRTPRTNVETTAPVDVVTAEEISHVGKTETGRILSTLAPSYISTPQTIADGSDHVDPAALRGLGPDQVLVLVNGKRRHKSALLNVNGTYGRGTVGTDLNAIPSSSIKRIEILRDGAASQYGSDAIAGVINIVTKDYTDLLDVTSMVGQTGSGDGQQIKTSANYGFKIGKKGFLNITGEFLKKDPTNRAGTYTGNVFTSTGAKGNFYYNMPDVAPAGGTPPMDDIIIAQRNLTRDSFKMRIGEAGAQDAIGSYNMEIPIDDVSTFYSFADLGHRNGDAAGFYRYPGGTSGTQQNVISFYDHGFLPVIQSNINDLEVTVGVRRKGDWTVDASITHGRNSFQFNVENSVNASLGTNSPTSFDAGTLASQQTLADLDLLHKIDTGVFKSLAFVVGTEVRTENYAITAGDQASWEFGPNNDSTKAVPTADMRVPQPGAQVFPGFQPSNAVDRSRNNVGVYTGFESEIVKGLDLDVGGRYENYSDFGNSFTGKAAVRVPLVKGVALRGAVSSGFRAPSLQQLWFSNTSSLFVPDSTGMLIANQIKTTNNADPVTRNGFGVPKLKQETSTNASAGFTMRPFDNFSLTADGYFIRLKNRITLTNPFIATPPTAATPTAAGLVIDGILKMYPGITGAQFFANAVDTDTMGADIVADYAINTGAGTVILDAALNLTKTEVKNVHVPSTLLQVFSGLDPSALNNLFFDRLSQNRLEDSVPHVKGNASLRYNYKQLSALVRADYYGQVRIKPVIVADTQTFGAKVLFDADIGYQITKNFQVSVGGDNLLNTFPDKNTKANNISLGRFVYNRNVSQFGLNGGFYYGKLELTFF